MHLKHPIYLIGFMGAGKTTMGRALSMQLGCDYTDIDDCIEAHMDMKISEIFSAYSEDYFRWIEAQICRKYKHGVISTGGGGPLHYNTIEWILRSGTVIFLDTDFDDIWDRLKISESRPLVKLSKMEDMRVLYNHRRPTYLKADIHYKPTSNIVDDIDNLVMEVRKHRGEDRL